MTPAALVPAMPHLLAGDPAPSWAELARATRTVGDRLRAAGVDTVLLLSTQWFTVLGHQVQCDARLRGRRTDENWYRYDYGHLDHDLAIDTDLAHRWADAIDAAGMQARRTLYEGFPVDTGTIVASRLLDPHGQGRWALVSCNLYAEPSAMAEVAAAGVIQRPVRPEDSPLTATTPSRRPRSCAARTPAAATAAIAEGSA